MTLAIVATTYITGSASGGTSAAINTVGATLLVLMVASNDAGTPFPVTPTDNLGNIWIGLTSQSSPNQAACQIFYAANPTTGAAHTFSVSGSSVYSVCSIGAFSGVAVTSPLDVQSGATIGGASTLQTGSVTPSQSNSLIVAGFAGANANAGATLTINDGFTVIFQEDQVNAQNFQGGGAYLIQTGNATVNPTWTSSSGFAAGSAAIAVFKPSASTGITGTLTETGASGTLVGAATPIVSGALTTTGANGSLSASATVTISGTLNETGTSGTLTATAKVSVFGLLAETGANGTLVASGTAGNLTTITGTLNEAGDNGTLSSVGVAAITGALNALGISGTLSAHATASVSGVLIETGANGTLVASGTVTLSIPFDFSANVITLTSPVRTIALTAPIRTITL